MLRDKIARISEYTYSRHTWLGRKSYLASKLGVPTRRFLHSEIAGGVVLFAATLIALVWANVFGDDSYHHLLEMRIRVGVEGFYTYDASLEEWVHDALMAIFFFVVGLEIKKELVVGELHSVKAAALPGIAAIGGMTVPALIYVAFNAGEPGVSGWAIPMATDIAFALGVVSLLGNRVSRSLKIFLLSLAIIDDIASILVIAAFYTDDLSGLWLLMTLLLVGVLAIMRFVRVWYMPMYIVVGLFLWMACLKSGVHPTIAGVVLGLFTPARPLIEARQENDWVVTKVLYANTNFVRMRKAIFEVRERLSMADRIHHILHPWSSFVILPLFALTSAGVSLGNIGESMNSSVTLGIVVGLVVGKLVGVSLFTWLAVRVGMCKLAEGITWGKVVGIGAVSGIGFTVSLFIAKLEFGPGGASMEHNLLMEQAKVGVLSASALAAVIGFVILVFSHRGGKPSSQDSQA